jgi:threonine synthase
LSGGSYTVLATAHPAKFAGIVEPITGQVKPPPCLEEAMTRTVKSSVIPPDFEALSALL